MLFCSIYFAESLFKHTLENLLKVKLRITKENIMQNIINGLPIAAVILLLAVGFAFW